MKLNDELTNLCILLHVKIKKGDMMNVNANGSMQQMHMQNMIQGAGRGQGKGSNGMRDIMQNLSVEDRNTLREQMSSLSQTDRESMISQMKQVDASSMSSDEYAQTLLDMINQSQTQQTTTTDVFASPTYA